MERSIQADRSSPFFTIVIATFNRVSLLGRAIRSVQAQTYPNYELIIVDDASTDGTQDYARSLDDKRLVYMRHDKNKGHTATLNTGIRAARGQFITLLDDDDEFMPKFLEKMCDAFSNASAEIGFGWCGIRIVRDTAQGEVFIKEKRWRTNYLEPNLAIGVGSGCGLTLRRSCLTEVGLFDEGFKTLGDREFMFRIARRFRFLVLPDVLVTIHQHSNPRVSSIRPETVWAYETIMHRNADYISQHPKLEHTMSRKAGVLHYRYGNAAMARRHIANALRLRSLDWKTWKMLLVYEILRRNHFS